MESGVNGEGITCRYTKPLIVHTHVYSIIIKNLNFFIKLSLKKNLLMSSYEMRKN